jgi:hypothetical protein
MKMDILRFVGAQSVDFPILGADPSGPFVLKSAEGLGPPDIQVKMARTVLERALYQGKSASLRQITALVGLQPDWDEGQTPRELRKQLYSLLTPRYGQLVRAEIVEMVGNVPTVRATAQGQISKMEAALFSKDPAVMLVLDCDFPYLLAPTQLAQQPVQVDVGGIRGFDVENDGDAPAGFKAEFVLMANVGNSLVLADENPVGQKIQIDGINWVAGDHFIVDTRSGSRGVWRKPGGGAEISVLNNLNADVSEWIQLYGGTNRLTLNTTAFDWGPTYSFRHKPAYWGV